MAGTITEALDRFGHTGVLKMFGEMLDKIDEDDETLLTTDQKAQDIVVGWFSKEEVESFKDSHTKWRMALLMTIREWLM